MESSIIGQRSTSSSQETSEPKMCWICLCTDDDNDDYENNREWVSPCKCRSSTRWVHQGCVLRWIDEKLKENLFFKAHCPLCLTQYIEQHKVNYLVLLLDILDGAANFISPFLTVGVTITAFCWSAASYGILTIIQVMGKREAITMMKNTNPYILLLVSASIPFWLIFGKLKNWGENLMLFIWRLTSQLPLLRTIMPSFVCEPVNEPVNNLRNRQRVFSIDIPDTTLCAALLLPTSAVTVGNLLFHSCSYSSLQKTLLGGLVYIAVKGAIRIYQRQQNLIREKTLKVLEYPITDDENN
ncbi:E3 ubiquitin-protein ligase MARCH5-like [Myzus persicae]|uniref:E3 ubiquitin-protein ligase MARCH5-like n=1 Tax=Myzus persicae TaxID=13164 RepID=UPI000B934413|nr:E3 ubiquitin-protein ligase MARCH5-like [Myzus persicae]